MNAETILANAKKIKEEAVEYLKGLMAAEIKANPSITSIVFKGEPNSYSDEGYAWEGMVCVSTEELDNEDFDPYMYEEGETVGVWSEDSDGGFYNPETKKWEKLTDENMNPLTAVAKRIFEEANQISEVIGMDGYFNVMVRR